MQISQLARRFINCYQGDFPLVEHPFELIANQLDTTEQTLCDTVRDLLDRRLLSRFGPLYDAARLGGAFTLAAMVFVLVTIVAIMRHGTHFLGFFVPKGVPAPMLVLVVPVEVLSYFMRPISHSVRLFANMTAGHTMLKVFGKFIVDMLAANAVLAVASILPFVLIVALTGLEVLIAVLQAYVFTILTCLYINDAVHLEH